MPTFIMDGLRCRRKKCLTLIRLRYVLSTILKDAAATAVIVLVRRMGLSLLRQRRETGKIAAIL